ncbi:MAG: ribonucleotide reductase subunit alpha [Betaproteobacteria bacterium]
MSISSFDDLLREARQQAEPQRLLFVFAGAELPADSTAEQRSRFEAGLGGALVPLMCVDKSLDELSTFAALTDESRQFDQKWVMVFVAGLTGRGGQPPTSKDAEAPLQSMVDSIKAGSISAFLAFDRNGQPTQLS